jgi:hypothetical protein
MQGKVRLPSLRAIEIFVAAGRALSFAAAAHAVNLTPSAVSRRIRDLTTRPRRGVKRSRPFQGAVDDQASPARRGRRPS